MVGSSQHFRSPKLSAWFAEPLRLLRRGLVWVQAAGGGVEARVLCGAGGAAGAAAGGAVGGGGGLGGAAGGLRPPGGGASGPQVGEGEMAVESPRKTHRAPVSVHPNWAGFWAG